MLLTLFVMNVDARLLALDIETTHGLVPGAPGAVRRLAGSDVRAVFGWSPHAAVLAVSDEVAAHATGALELARGEAFAPEVMPAVIGRLRGALEQAGVPGARVSGGPSFVFPDELADGPPVPLPVIVSDAGGREHARRLVRPANWEPGEWRELVAGALGPWAMAIDGDHPVSITHTPRNGTGPSQVSSAAGVWTRADHRGMGLATAATRAWWVLERRRTRIIFYGTDAHNLASRGVARKLGLRPLGWMWTIR